MTAADVPRLTLKWALGFPDATSAWAPPTIAGGRLFVGSQNGTVYALDAKSGCIHWTFTAKSGVRTALTVGTQASSAGGAVYFGDTGANVYSLDAATGQLRWTRRVDEHVYARVTGSLTLHEDRLYVPVSSIEETAASQPGYECCSFRGSLLALDAGTGSTIWQTFTVPAAQVMGKNAAGVALWGPSGVGIWYAPTIDTQTFGALRDDGQHLQRCGPGDGRCGPGDRPGDWCDQVDTPGHAGRRLRMSARHGELRREGRPRFRLRHAGDAGDAC